MLIGSPSSQEAYSKIFFLSASPVFLTALPRCVCARVKGADIRVLREYNVDFVLGNPGCGGGHLGEYGVRPLSDFGCTHLKLYRSILIEHHAASRRFKRNRVYACFINEQRHPHTAADIAGLVLVSRTLSFQPKASAPRSMHAFSP